MDLSPRPVSPFFPMVTIGSTDRKRAPSPIRASDDLEVELFDGLHTTLEALGGWGRTGEGRMIWSD